MFDRLILSTLVVISALLFQPLRATAQTNHDRRHSGLGRRRDRRQPAGRDRRGAQPRHELRADARDRSRRPLRVPAARARQLSRDVHARRVRDARAGEHRADRRPGDHPAGGDEGVRRLRDGDGHDRNRRDRDLADGVGDDAESEHDRHDPDSRAQVRGSADAHAGRGDRAGRRRRRDQLRRSARHLQQHQPGRRRLQQRVLRRAGRRTARVDRHHARRDQGVPGDRDRRAGRVRPHRRRRRQRRHQVRHQCRQGQPLLLPAHGSADRAICRTGRSSKASIASSTAARSAARSRRTRRSSFWRWKGSTATSSGRT